MHCIVYLFLFIYLFYWFVCIYAYTYILYSRSLLLSLSLPLFVSLSIINLFLSVTFSFLSVHSISFWKTTLFVQSCYSLNRSSVWPQTCGPQGQMPRLLRSRAPSVQAHDLASLKHILICIISLPLKLQLSNPATAKSRRKTLNKHACLFLLCDRNILNWLPCGRQQIKASQLDWHLSLAMVHTFSEHLWAANGSAWYISSWQARGSWMPMAPSIIPNLGYLYEPVPGTAARILNDPTYLDVSLHATIFKLRFLHENNTWSLALTASTGRLDPAFSFSYFRFARSMVSRVCVIVAIIASASSSAAGTSKLGFPRLAGTCGSRAKFTKDGVNPVALHLLLVIANSAKIKFLSHSLPANVHIDLKISPSTALTCSTLPFEFGMCAVVNRKSVPIRCCNARQKCALKRTSQSLTIEIGILCYLTTFSAKWLALSLAVSVFLRACRCTMPVSA